MPNNDAYEWLDQNMHNSYPFADSSTLLSESGVTLPQSFLVDCTIAIPAVDAIDAEKFYVSTIVRSAQSFYLEISYDNGTSPFVVLVSDDIGIGLRNTATVSERIIALHASGNAKSVAAGLGSAYGNVIVGSCIDMVNQGTLTFSGPESAGLLSIRVVKNPLGLESFTAVNRDGSSHTFTSNFTIKAGDGVAFSVTTDEQGANVLTVNRVATAAESSAVYNSVADVVNAVYNTLGKPIRRINGIAPDSDGNIVIDGGDCVKIDNVSGGIKISNPCATPCCSSADSDQQVKTALSLLESASTRLTSYYEGLMTNVNALQARLSSLIAGRK